MVEYPGKPLGRESLRRPFEVALAIWALCTGAFYFLRFSFVFFDANRAAISGLFQRLFSD